MHELDLLDPFLNDDDPDAEPVSQMDLREVSDTCLINCPWEFEITKDAQSQWAALDETARKRALAKLWEIGNGFW